MATTMRIIRTPLSIKCWCPGRTRRTQRSFWTICSRSTTRLCAQTSEVRIRSGGEELEAFLVGGETLVVLSRDWLCVWAVHGAETSSAAVRVGRWHPLPLSLNHFKIRFLQLRWDRFGGFGLLRSLQELGIKSFLSVGNFIYLVGDKNYRGIWIFQYLHHLHD